MPVRVLFVCHGNICRSPTAEGVLKGLVREQGLQDVVEVESAGTGPWHVGERPDARAVRAAAARGVALSGLARQVTPADFERFDLLVATDRDNHDALLRAAPDAEARERVHLLREFDPRSAELGDLDVPDPYYGGEDGFEHVLDVVEAGARGLLEQLRAEGRL